MLWFDKENRQRRYYLDFYLPACDLYVDMENKYLMTQDVYKNRASSENNKVNLLVDSLENVLVELKKWGISIIGLR